MVGARPHSRSQALAVGVGLGSHLGHVVIELGRDACCPVVDGPYACIEALPESADLAVDAIPHRTERGQHQLLEAGQRLAELLPQPSGLGAPPSRIWRSISLSLRRSVSPSLQ